MFIESISMKDFRCFEQAEGSFVYPGKKSLPEGALPNVTLLMGINGSGKTSVLKAVSLSVLSPIIWFIGFRPYMLVRRGGRSIKSSISARFVLYKGENVTGAHWREMEIEKSFVIRSGPSGDFFDLPSSEQSTNGYTLQEAEQSPGAFFCIGYGALRRSSELESVDSQASTRRHPRFQRVAGLFEDYITLYPLAAWYPTLESKARAKEVRSLLNSLLPEGTEFTGTFQDAEAVFTHNDVNLPFGALSDGYRSYIGLVADMLYHLNHVCPKKAKLTDLTGVVLIDDIDVHLHPKWQREVVPKLAGTFSNLQFIITSHSPLVVGSLHAANIRVVEDNSIHEYTESIDGMTSDQILTSSYFGLDSTRSVSSETKLASIAPSLADTQDPKLALQYIRELTGQTNGKKKPTKPAKP